MDQDTSGEAATSYQTNSSKVDIKQKMAASSWDVVKRVGKYSFITLGVIIIATLLTFTCISFFFSSENNIKRV